MRRRPRPQPRRNPETLLGPRNFFSDRPFTGFDDSLVRLGIRPKPFGLWYGFGDEWLEWVLREMPHWTARWRHRYRIILDPSRILAIRTSKQLDAFVREHLAPLPEDREQQWIDWSAVARRHDGFEVAPIDDAGCYAFDWCRDMSISSGCVWNARAILHVQEVPMPRLPVPAAGNLGPRRERV